MKNNLYSGRILLADDEESLLKLYNNILENVFKDFQVETFTSGGKLEKRLNENLDDVKLVILDYNFKDNGPNGGEIIRNYAPSLRSKAIPFILVYGGEEGIGHQAMRDGAFTYLKKPCTNLKLASLSRRALARFGHISEFYLEPEEKTSYEI